jgi:hypothetical protein
MTPHRRSGLLTLLLLAAIGCGSVTAQSDAGPASGTAGSTGGAGQTGTAGNPGSGSAGSSGSGSAGSTSGAGSGNAGGGGGSAGGGHAGAGGATAGAGGGHAGAGGGAAGAGGGTAGAGGASACAQVGTVDRSCSVDGDCLAVTHTTNCCGSAVWIGIRSSEKDHYTALESACDRTYPACGCAAGPPVTDDGSVVPFGGMAGVSCQAGMCKTFSKACDQPCGAGRSCVTCMMPDAGATSACSLQCMKDTDCTEPGRTKCQFTSSTGVCTDSTMACGLF